MFTISEIFRDLVWKKLNPGETALAVAKYPASGSFINVGPYDRFGFMAIAGGVTSAITLQVQQDTGATQTASIKNVSGATVTIPATGEKDFYFIEVDNAHLDINNSFDYVTLDATGAAGSDDYAALAFVGMPQVRPTAQDSATGVTVAGGVTTSWT